jgi:hypothetical protein
LKFTTSWIYRFLFRIRSLSLVIARLVSIFLDFDRILKNS